MFAELLSRSAMRILGDLPPDGREYWSGFYWDREAAEQHEVLGPHYQDEKQELVRMLEAYAAGARRVIEFCCGTGEFTRMVAELTDAKEIVALDISEPALRKAAERVSHDGLRLVRGDFWDDHDLGTADLVLCADSLQHLGNYDDVLARMRSCLSPGGVLIANVWTLDNYHELERLRYGSFGHFRRSAAFFGSAFLIRVSGGRWRSANYRTKLLRSSEVEVKLKNHFGEILYFSPGRYHTTFACAR